MTELELTIIVKLKNHHLGKDNAEHFKKLAHYFGLNEREFRRIVTAIIVNGIAPICSNSHDGYYYPSTLEEFEHAQNEDTSRIGELAKKVDGRQQAWDREYQPEKYEQSKLMELLEV